ncbi:MAG: hypothetical protein AABZ53_16865 [Planctomycetota bacterium]
MRDVPLFITYRRDDGARLAGHVFDTLDGVYLTVGQERERVPARISVFMDRNAVAVADWTESILRELARAQELVVVCTCGVCVEQGSEDWVHKEIRWWIANRPDRPPILVSNLGPRWIPQLIRNRWPNIQLVHVDPDRAGSGAGDPAPAAAWLERVTRRIENDVAGENVDLAWERIPNMPGLYHWRKDKNLKYIECSESYARMAGHDSPEAMRGMTDYQMPWKELADTFRLGDSLLIIGRSPPRENVQEQEIMVNRRADILVTENRLLLKSGECVGVQGYFVDITDTRFVLPDGPRVDADGSFCLGALFNNERLSKEEVLVLQGVIRLNYPDRIAAEHEMRTIEVDGLIDSLRRKLQCTTIGDIITACITSGIPFKLFGPTIIPRDTP